MSTVLKSRLVKIGNSHGVRIPKVWLDQLDLGAEVELSMQSDQIVIRPAHPPRHGWEEAFQAMAAHGDDRLLDQPHATRWDADEWEW